VPGCLSPYFWWCRKETTDKALKIVDYIFLSLGFVGVFGALDVQANIYKSRIPSILARHAVSIEFSDPCKSNNLDREDCHWPEIVKIILKRPYDHLLLGMQLEKSRLNEDYPDGITKSHQDFIDEVQSLYDAMERDVYQHIDPIEQRETDKRIFAYYVLCAGLALRLTKVSAEVFEWHVPKSVPAAIVLPKNESDAHIAV
jgi:hypothetical protein